MKKIAFSIIPLTMLAACSSELVETANDITMGDEVQKVTVQSHPFEFDDDTRTTLTASDKSITFSWADYDAMGVFPVAPYSNNQAKRTLSVPAGADAHYATFDGAGWELKEGNTYAAYVPYNGSLPSSTGYDEVPVDLTGQDGTLETIGKKFDYMYATSSRGTVKNLGGKNTEIVFDFQHAVSIIQLNLTMPSLTSLDREEWTSVTLSSVDGSKMWITSATMNVATGEVTPKKTSSEVTLSLSNVITKPSRRTITLYLAVLPTMAKDFTITATTRGNESYTGYFMGKTFKAGKAYRYTGDVQAKSGDGFENGYAYVDLGLSSGLKWATMNVGATSVTDYGKYYAWGETKANGEEDTSNGTNYRYNSRNSYVKSYYGLETYKWCNGSETSMTKYCANSKYGTVDNKTTLDPEDDAAVQNWGGAWRMPTHEEQEELVNNCYWVWTSSYKYSGVAGWIVFAVKQSLDKGKIVNYLNQSSDMYSLSDSHIFLPASGLCMADFGANTGSWSGYLSSSLYGSARLSWGIYFYDFDSMLSSLDRSYGFSVRAVCK